MVSGTIDNTNIIRGASLVPSHNGPLLFLTSYQPNIPQRQPIRALGLRGIGLVKYVQEVKQSAVSRIDSFSSFVIWREVSLQLSYQIIQGLPFTLLSIISFILRHFVYSTTLQISTNILSNTSPSF